MFPQNYTLIDNRSPNIHESEGPVTPCNFSSNLQCNSTLGRCKIGKYMFPSQFANAFLTYQTFVTNLHLLGVEMRCMLQEKLHRVTEQGRKKQVKVGGGGSGFRGHFFIKKGHLQVNSFAVAIQRNCL